MPPVCIGGRMTGGSTALDAESSQFLSALLLACPLAGNDSMIRVTGLRSRPYVGMTLEHVRRSGANIWARDMSSFFIPGGQQYKPTTYCVPGDHSSAAFLHAAALITGSDIRVEGLDPGDPQGDKAFPELAGMAHAGDAELDLADNPDLLPVLAVLACFSERPTILRNAAHARSKESDRISAMALELGKMGASVEEMPDGLKIHGPKLSGAELDAHGDHRVAMALAVAGLGAEGRTIINGADTISKSYPGFVSDLASLGAGVRTEEE
jgi:3-phosphoshikimate 1-carboxyvinyltransferase